MRHGLPRLLYKLAACRARRIMAVSEGTKRTVLDAGVRREKVVVVPNLVDIRGIELDVAGRRELRQSWGVSERALVVGCISRLQRRKRTDVVIDAMAYLTGEVLLVIAGEGEEEGALRERAAPYGERVRFVPNVRDNVSTFLSACDLLLFAPSPTEGEPRAIVLAQLMGIPVVATDPEGTEGLIPRGGGTVISPSHDSSALAAAIAAYRDDPERRRREGAIARRATAESHDPELTLRVVEEALGLRR